MYGPPEMPFKFYGYLEFTIGMSSNWTTIEASAPGRIFLELPNGAKLEMNTKKVELSGMMSNSKYFNSIGAIKVTDLGTQLHSVTTFDSQKNQRTGYWSSWVKGADKVNKETGVLDNRRDLFTIEIYQESTTERMILAEGHGSYLESITFGEGSQAQTLWTVKDSHLATEWSMPDPKLILPSDSSLRPDGLAI